MATQTPGGHGDSSAGQGPDAPSLNMSDFLLHICHDLKGSLRTIRLHTELLAREHEAGDRSRFAEHLGAMVADTMRLERLADGLSRYSIASEIDQRTFVMAPMEVILRTELAMLQKEVEEHQAEVTYDPLPRVFGDPDRLRQLLDELLRNALLHHGQAAPRIHLSARPDGDFMLFSVRDNGQGIDADYLKRIFEPFERLKGHQAAGPGLGLTTCGEIVRRHGGRIWAESVPGSGTTIFFTLSAAGSQPAAE